MKPNSKKGNVAIGSGGAILIFIMAFFLFIYPSQERQEVHVGIKFDAKGSPTIDYLNVQTVKIPYIQLFEKKGADGQYALKLEANWILPPIEPVSFSEERVNVGLGDHSFVVPKKPPIEDGSWIMRAEIYEFKDSKWVKVNEKEIEIGVKKNG